MDTLARWMVSSSAMHLRIEASVHGRPAARKAALSSLASSVPDPSVSNCNEGVCEQLPCKGFPVRRAAVAAHLLECTLELCAQQPHRLCLELLGFSSYSKGACGRQPSLLDKLLLLRELLAAAKAI